MDGKKKKMWKAIGIGAILLGAGFAGGALTVPAKIEQVPYKVVDTTAVDKLTADNAALESQISDLNTQLAAKPTVVTEIKTVESPDLPTVLDFIYNNEGNIEYITNGLSDTELNQIVDRIVLVNDFKSVAIDKTYSDAIHELDGMKVGDVTLNRHDMERLSINKDAQDITVEDIDFDYKDADLQVTGSVRQDNIRYDFKATVMFNDGNFDELKIDSVVPHITPTA